MVRENVGQTTVCAVVEHRKSIAFPFDIKFTFIPRSASMYFLFFYDFLYSMAVPSIFHSLSSPLLDYLYLYVTCVGGSKLECEVYRAFLIRLCVNHSYDSVQYSIEDRTYRMNVV